MSTPLEAGIKIPDIAMGTPEGGEVKPSDFAGQKLVLFFYPKDNTPGCTTEAKDFTAMKADFDAAGTAILGISKDSAKKHQNFIAKHDLTVALATDAEEGGLSDTLGIWTEKQMYGKTYMGMVRTTILVGADGVIAQVWNKVKVKGHAEEVLAAAQAL
ncbi:peroxiredoxin [Altererythrobacter sp. RZ02]|uniref:thioredoxin-dependent peroxiredoxin n=1 Tax=Pontixanthobacter rizhaonensis TaxID=2730337 RepID=A0A848QIL4_9SPHN|nr:peroxiredoxin [Pontixanthobacter rizhaonensis]NMW32492.1 peroxiredoxin [Pontixanthobacter rizhaonensis]